MAVWHDLKIDKWMNSYSTNLKANAGGWKGKALATGERIPFYDQKKALPLGSNSSVVLPWKAAETVDNRSEIQFVIGSEWMWLTDEARESFQENLYQVSNDADRMGYRINGKELQLNQQEQLVSSAVNFGTVQLLPNGHMIILMADHQTTGGYPRVAHIISAHLPILAQKKVNDVLQFRMTDLVTAEQKLTNQQKYLQQLQIACKFKMENYLHASM
jgi:antagonist of KipI